MIDAFSPSSVSPFEMCWYVVNTKPNHERQAEQNLRRMGVECFLPLLQEEKNVRRQIRTVISPLFPGYLFVRINLSEHYRTVVYARGVRKMVEFGSIPVDVDTAIINEIRFRVNSEGHLLKKSDEMSSGQLVRIKDGPLAGLEAIFMQEMSGRQRAMVLLQALTLQARVVLDISQIAPSVAA
jgi:transcriptional antiterminator RfaH